MQVSDTPPGWLSAQQRDVIDRIAASGAASPAQCAATERFAFYERVKAAHAIVQTGEMQPFANFIFKKGVLADALLP
jgi:L-fucose mutarotase